MIKKLFKLIYFLLFSFSIFGVSLSEIEGLKNLSNYNELKNKQTIKILEGKDKGERRKGIGYEKGASEPFTGVLVSRNQNKIIDGIFFYRNGRLNGDWYEYYENGQLYLTGNYVNDKIEGKSFEYYLNGKLKDERFYKNGIIINSMEYYENGRKKRIFKTTEGLRGIITGYYEDGIHKSSEMSVIQEYDRKGGTNYIMDGESTAYDKKGQIMGILNYKDGKLTGLEQKLFKNGKLKYDFISASEKPVRDIKAMDFYVEYFDNSEQKKLDCKELASNNWRCKEYSKNGKFKREFDSPTFSEAKDWSFGINVLLGILNILF